MLMFQCSNLAHFEVRFETSVHEFHITHTTLLFFLQKYCVKFHVNISMYVYTRNEDEKKSYGKVLIII